VCVYIYLRRLRERVRDVRAWRNGEGVRNKKNRKKIE
jgi:hypothetical protein